MHKVWMISEYYYPVVISTGYYVTEIAEYCAKKGVDINVISSNNTYYESDETTSLKEEEHNGVKIFRSIRKQISKDNNGARLIRLLSLSASFFIMAIKRIKEGDNVIVLTNPAFFLLLMPLVKRFKKCNYHILVHDIFPENLVSLGKVRQGGFLFDIIKYLFDRSYSKADSCIAIGHDMAHLLKEKVKGNTKISVITNWSNVDEVVPCPKVTTKTFASISCLSEDNVVFQYAGNLGKAQGLNNLLSAIDRVKNNDAKFLFIGAGAKLDEVNKFAKGHTNTISIGFVSRAEQNDFLNACDVGIVTLADGMYGLGVPSKSYNIMAAGRPILYVGSSDSEIALCIEKYKIGWIVKPNAPDELASQIEEIVNEKEQIREMGARARNVAVSVFGKDVVLEQYYQYIAN